MQKRVWIDVMWFEKWVQYALIGNVMLGFYAIIRLSVLRKNGNEK